MLDKIIINKKETIRLFKISLLNFNANDYFVLIDWENNQITEPLIISTIDQERLKLGKKFYFLLILKILT